MATEVPAETQQGRQARIVRLLAGAMQWDVAGQRELVEAHARSRTDAVYWKRGSYDAEGQELHEEDRRLRDRVQCTMIQVHLAIEGVRLEIARSRALLGSN